MVRVAGAHDRGHAELAGDDRGVAGTPTTVGDDRRGGLHHGLPVGGRAVGHQHLAWLEFGNLREALHHARGARGDLLADRSTLDQDLATAVAEHIALQQGGSALRGDRLGPSLDDVDLAVDPVLRPLHVHRPAVVALDLDRIVGELEDVLVADAIALAVGLRGRDVANRFLAPALDKDHLDRLVAHQAAQHGAVAGLERRLVDVELVRVNGPLHDVLPESVRARDEHHVTEPRFGVEREEHARRREVGPHHLHHPDRQPNREVVKSLIDPIMDRAVGEQTREAPAA